MRLFQHRGDGFFGDAGDLGIAVRGLGQPSGQLFDGVGVVQPGELTGLGHQLAFDRSADDESAAHHFHVSGHASRVHHQVGFPLLLHKGGHGKRRQAVVNLHFGDNILPVVLFEQRPFGGAVPRKIASAVSVGIGGLAGNAEIADKGLARRQLFLIFGQAHRPARRVQRCRVAAVERVEHRIAPLIGGEPSQILAESEPFKGRVVGVFDVQGIFEGIFQPKGNNLPACHVDDLNGHPVETVCEKQNLKRRVEDISV